MNILYTAPVATRSGYGDKSRDIASYLFKKYTEKSIDILSTRWGECSLDGLSSESELNTKILQNTLIGPPEKSPDISIHVAMPSEFKALGKYNIGITSGVEVDTCPESFIYGCNRMNLVIVPYEFKKQTQTDTEFSSGIKCTTPNEVVFEGYTPEITDNTTEVEMSTLLDTINEEFCFLSVGQWAADSDRKNIRGLVNVFNDTFRDVKNPPALVLKIYGSSHCISDELEIKKQLYSILSTNSNHAPIYVVYGNVTPSEMTTLYSHSKIKCLVSLTRGEGFGRPLLEASVNGLPIMVSKWSGHLDFLDKKLCKLLPGTHITATGLGEFAPTDAKWFDVDLNNVSVELVDMVSRYEVHESRATKLRKINSQKYSIESMHTAYDNVLSKYI